MAGGREWGGEDIEDKSNANEDHEDGEDAPPLMPGSLGGARPRGD